MWTTSNDTQAIEYWMSSGHLIPTWTAVTCCFRNLWLQDAFHYYCIASHHNTVFCIHPYCIHPVCETFAYWYLYQYLCIIVLYIVGTSSVRSSDTFDAGGNEEGDAQLNDLISHVKSTNLLHATYDDLVFQNDHETFDKVRNIQYRRATDRRNQAVVPML